MNHNNHEKIIFQNNCIEKLLLLSCRWGYYDGFCNSGIQECRDMLEHGIGLIHHVGARKKSEAGTLHDIMFLPITDAFHEFKIGRDIEKYLLSPLVEGLQKIQNRSKCSKVFKNFFISIKKISKIKGLIQ
jgi:hypothetical protein